MRHIVSNLPISVITDYSKEACKLILDQLATNPDVVVFDFPHSAVLAPQNLDIPSVMFTHNVETEIFKRHMNVSSNLIKRNIWRNQYKKMLKYEENTLKKFSSVVAVSERDRQWFIDNFNINKVFVIPTGVDLDYFKYVQPKTNKRVVFIGSMDWMANIDGIEYFMNSVWPNIVDEFNDAYMTIIGRNPPSILVNKAKAKKLNWHFTGFVDDVREHIKGASVCVIPLRVGGGTRIKVFEAMAMGVPIVSTSIGVEGLPIFEDEHYLRGDCANDFAAAVKYLLKNPNEQKRLSKNARRFVEENFSFEIAAAAFENICLSATN